MKKSYLSLIIIALIVSVAIFTNPNLDKHKQAVKGIFNTYWQKNFKAHGVTTTEKAVETMIGDSPMVDKLIDNIVSSDDYLVFSTTKISWGGKAKVIGFGVFGNVYLTDDIKDLGSAVKN